MPDIFGLDIAGIVNDSLQAAGGLPDGSFVLTTPGERDPDDPTAGNGGTPSTHAFKGFFENLTVTQRDGSLVRAAGQYVSIMGASITPPAEPVPGVVITLEGRTLRAVELTHRDAAAALYVLKVEGA